MAEPIVRFYVLAHNDVQARYQLVCQLVEKALDQAQRVFILCADDTMLTELDNWLWQYPPQSFLPHCSTDSAEKTDSPVLLAAPPTRAEQCDVFINLSLELQADIPRNCTRVFEIVSQEEKILTATRARYKHYRERDLQPETHTLSA